MDLTQAQRVIIYNQLEILKTVDPARAAEYEEQQEIVSYGYELFYDQLNPMISEGHVDRETCDEVLEILNLFRLLEYSKKDLSYVPKSLGAQFEGFDANEPDGYYSFAKFVRRKQGKFTELSEWPDNSHSSSSLLHYRRMLQTWRALGKPTKLTPEQIEKIADGS
ncbi:YfbU family protein [Mesorhizobium sp. M1004]|uniref:YfbU family protein n=1 Tax=Mesorhizobium sp. M1004 TaxID=2957046 RepID=UPI00333CD393